MRLRHRTKRDTPPIFDAAFACGLWAVLAGRPKGEGGVPEARTCAGTRHVVRLTGERREAKLSDRCVELVSDTEGATLWCVVGDRPQYLERVDATTGESQGIFKAASPRAVFEHLDPVGHRAFVVEPPEPDDRSTPPTSTLIAYRLPL